jgi:FtsH-binding integral membrane protein
MVCYRPAARKKPINFILLFMFTLCLAYMVSDACSKYNANIILMAVSMLCCMLVGITLYAHVTEVYFSVLGGMFYAFLFCILGIGIASRITDNPLLNYLYSFIGVISYGLYLILDT